MTGSPGQDVRQRPSLTQMFTSFLALGATAFGGPAMVLHIRRMAVEEKRWLDDRSFNDGVAFCQAIPGATSMQVSAYVGLRARGIGGAAVCFVGFGLPAFILMMILSALYARMHAVPRVILAFSGLQAIIVAIVGAATVSFGRTTLRDRWHVLLAILAACLYGLKIHPVLAIVATAVLGLLVIKEWPHPGGRPAAPGKIHYPKSVVLLFLVTAAIFVVLFLAQRRLFDLAVLMFRIDLVAFGGGFAALPIMFHAIVEVRSWMDSATFLNGIALGQLTPGPIVITAGFVGYLLHGPVGGIVATYSVFLPSFLTLIVLVPYLDRLRGSPYFQRATSGVLCSFVGLLLTVTIILTTQVPWDFRRALLAAASFVALLLGVRIPWVVLAGIVLSLIVL